MTNMIGEFGVEKDARENQKSREIVSEIMNFGVNDRMILVIITSLAMNLERVEHMKEITKCVRNLEESSAFIIDRLEEGEKVGFVAGTDDEVTG